MTVEIQIRTTQPCPTCAGVGVESNAEWTEFGEAEAEYRKQNPKATLEERHEWERKYWESKDYKPWGPWDERTCEDCSGTGTQGRERWVTVPEESLLYSDLVGASQVAKL